EDPKRGPRGSIRVIEEVQADRIAVGHVAGSQPAGRRRIRGVAVGGGGDQEDDRTPGAAGTTQGRRERRWHRDEPLVALQNREGCGRRRRWRRGRRRRDWRWGWRGRRRRSWHGRGGRIGRRSWRGRRRWCWRRVGGHHK